MIHSLPVMVSVRYWQDFQDALANTMKVNIYVLDAQGRPFSRFSRPLEVCQNTNGEKRIVNETCSAFYRATLQDVARKRSALCPFGVPMWIYQLGSYAQNIGYVVVTPEERPEPLDREDRMVQQLKADDVYRAVNVVLTALLEKTLLGLQRLELNSIYEISRLIASTVELDKVLDLITNTLIIIYQADMCFVGLRNGERITVVECKGEYGSLLVGREWPLFQPLMERIFFGSEPSRLTPEELRTLTGAPELTVPAQSEIVVYPLISALGIVGLLGIVMPAPPNEDGTRNLQIYANFAAVALGNATLVARLEKEASSDVLTDLPNRRALYVALVAEMERTLRYGYPLSVIFLDLDGFKTYNDTYGHLAGDVVLQKAAEIIRNCIRSTDVACRYGGEEFVVILPGSDGSHARMVAERIRAALEGYDFPHRGITASIGVASLRDGDSVDSLIARADAACYEAKKRGGNRVFVYDAEQ